MMGTLFGEGMMVRFAALIISVLAAGPAPSPHRSVVAELVLQARRGGINTGWPGSRRANTCRLCARNPG